MLLTIVLNYKDAAKLYRFWAEAENSIDFRNDRHSAERCTSAFAAVELKHFLEKGDPSLQVEIAEASAVSGPIIELQIADKDSGGGFTLIPDGQRLSVVGDGRNGLLNAIYELLRFQGWRWLEPGIYGESAPTQPALNWPKETKRVTPSFYFRMIDQYRESDDSVDYLKWMLRNRLNVVFWKPATCRFAAKLGMLMRKGGHLLQKMLAPGRELSGGGTLWEEHPEWYGLPADGLRTKENCTHTQLCLSQPELLQFIAEEVRALFIGEMADVDIMDLWGFDTWGKNCSCTECAQLGNGADQNLKMLSYVRNYLNEHLDRRVWLDTLSYEGSVTMEPPSLPVPENLRQSGDIVLIYPIRRCYRHTLADPECSMNHLYHESVTGWGRDAQGLSIWSGEYYNVSRFEDLPLCFMTLIPQEMRYYKESGCSGATYMHNFPTCWGVRSLTQLQHTQYAWDVNTQDEEFLADYFQRKYQYYAQELRQAYEMIERCGAYISSLRNWGTNTLTAKLSAWEGEKPEKPLAIAHFDSSEALLTELRCNVADWEKVLGIIQQVLRAEQQRNSAELPAIADIPPVVTPLELEKIRYYDTLEYRLGEDLRIVRYGRDSWLLMLCFVEYYEVRRKNQNGNKEWECLEAVAHEMESYYLPITFENPTPGQFIKDALTRTQLRMTLTRCRGARK
ncbi:MAG: DUF4838 domain-containing protein [Lentisphaeria bacterium]